MDRKRFTNLPDASAYLAAHLIVFFVIGNLLRPTVVSLFGVSSSSLIFYFLILVLFLLGRALFSFGRRTAPGQPVPAGFTSASELIAFVISHLMTWLIGVYAMPPIYTGLQINTWTREGLTLLNYVVAIGIILIGMFVFMGFRYWLPPERRTFIRT